METLEIPLSEHAISLFSKYINKESEDGCWNWTGSRVYNKLQGETYGKFSFRIAPNQWVTRNSHNIAFRIAHGRWRKKDLVLRHSCHNRLCVNPAHLSEGTQQDNINDSLKAGRIASGNALPQAKLTEELVRAIHAEYIKGERTQKSIADQFNVTQTRISQIVQGKSWGHLGLSFKVPSHWKGRSNAARKSFTSETFAPIFDEIFNKAKKIKEIAIEHNVSRELISRYYNEELKRRGLR